MTGSEGVESLHASSPPVAPQLTLVIPAYNESSRLEAGVDRLSEAVAAGAIDPSHTEFVVVDDGSEDDTSSVAKALFGTFPHVQIRRLPENRGKGAAVRIGVAAASAPIIAFADADMAIDPSQTPQFVAALATTYVAIGSRAASGSTVDRPSIRRSVMNRSFNHFVNAVTGVSLNDTQCGFKAFRAPAAKLLFHCAVTERMAFDVEILALARQLGMPIAEVPVHWLRVKGSRVRSWVDPASMVKDVFHIRGAGNAAPDIAALRISPPHQDEEGLAALLDEFSATLPLIRRPGTDTLLLCPLTADEQVEAIGTALATRSQVSRVSVPVSDLRSMAPLSISWNISPVAFPG